MRLMLAALLVLAAAWSAYWWIGSGAEKTRVATWLEQTQAVTASNQVMRGFPNRYDTTLDAVTLDAGSLVWEMPRLQLFRLSYQPGHYVISLPPEQRLTLGGTNYPVAMQDGRASVVYRQGAFDHSNAVIDAPTLANEAGWTLSAATMLFATRLAEGGHEIGLDIASLETEDAKTDLRLNGILRFPGGVPEGVLTISAPDPAALAKIGAAIELPELTHGAELTFSNGQVSLAGRTLGAAPQLPF